MSDDRVTIIAVTAAYEFTKERTVKHVLRSIRTAADVFCYCSPCFGSSSWQRLNLELARKKGWKHTVVSMIGHWDLHWRLWNGFERVVRHCAKIGATVLLEWPRYCAYWGEPKVSSFLREMRFGYNDFDGCMYGLISTRQSGSLPLRKTWRIAYSSSHVYKYLHYTCDGS
ncbi:MAG: hypothetical protein ACKPKO_45515, partial [Candidatus Fonsibacter sp.]